jgi:hypothetical protein
MALLGTSITLILGSLVYAVGRSMYDERLALALHNSTIGFTPLAFS